MFRVPAALVALALSAVATGQTPAASNPAAAANAVITAPLPADQAAMKAHVMFLASDAMKGREAGSPEYDIAAQYVAAQFYAAGLRPGGDAGGYLQRVPLVSYRPAGEGSFVWAARGKAPRPLAFGTDYIPAPDPARAQTSVSAPVMFVGYGIDAPPYRYDSYKGANVRGKIVAFFRGAPASFGGEERAFFGQDAQKLRAAAARGAIGAVMLTDPAGTPGDMQRLSAGYDRPRMNWADPDGKAPADALRTPLLGTLSPVAGAALFGPRWAAIARATASQS